MWGNGKQMAHNDIDTNDLVENPNARIPVALVLDTSGSMDGQPINELNEGVKMFFSAINNDDIAKYSAEIAVVTFGGSVECILDFAGIDSQSVPRLRAGGGTPMGAAVSRALGMLDARKNKYRSAGVDYYQPWMVLMTDGHPTDNVDSAARKTASLVENKKMTIFPIGIGPDADMNTLAEFSPSRTPLKLKGLSFGKFFEWLSKSVSKVSQSMPGEDVDLPGGIEGWGTV